MRGIIIAIAAASVFTATPARAQNEGRAQTEGRAYNVELALPFGATAGKLVSEGDHLIFIDDQRPEASFAVNRSDIESIEDQGGILTVALRQPLRDRPGQPTRLSFRTQAPGAANELTSWARSATPGTGPSGSAERQQTRASGMSYQAQHDHRIGSCDGRLIITKDQISYESVTDVDHSRQWAMKDIKELNRSSPYKIEIKPFTGSDYTLRLIGNGMSNEEYATLVKWVTAARTAK